MGESQGDRPVRRPVQATQGGRSNILGPGLNAAAESATHGRARLVEQPRRREPIRGEASNQGTSALRGSAAHTGRGNGVIGAGRLDIEPIRWTHTRLAAGSEGGGLAPFTAARASTPAAPTAHIAPAPNPARTWMAIDLTARAAGRDLSGSPTISLGSWPVNEPAEIRSIASVVTAGMVVWSRHLFHAVQALVGDHGGAGAAYEPARTEQGLHG